MNEKISNLTEQNIASLNGKKSNFLMNAVLLSLGSAFTVIIFFVAFKEMPGGWFIGIPLAIVLIFYVSLMYLCISKMSKISQEIKAGVKKTITVKLDNYDEKARYDDNGRYTGSDYFFFAENRKYEVTKEQYYSSFNGDLVNISFTPNLEYVLQIEKAGSEKHAKIS